MLERKLDERYHRKLHIVTQNVDGLHQQAGSADVLELHGHLRSVQCMSCGYVSVMEDQTFVLRTINKTKNFSSLMFVQN